MKKITTICMFAVTLYIHAQQVNVTPAALNGNGNPSSQWIMTHYNEMVGYIDKNGVEIVPPLYDSIGSFGAIAEGVAVIQSPAGLKGLIDTTGTVIVEPKYNFIENADEYKKDLLKVELDGYIGFIDKYGNVLVAPTYDYVEPPRKIAHNTQVKKTVK